MDDHSLVTEEIIRKYLQQDYNIAKDILDLEDREPILNAELTRLVDNFIENMKQQYPVINNDQPRIFADVYSGCQAMFLTGFFLGKGVMRDKIDSFFDEIISSGKPSPEEDDQNFY